LLVQQSLVCPVERLPLALADAETLARLQAAAKAGSLHTVSGRQVVEPFEAALVRSDGKVAYLLIDRIARLVAEEGVRLERLTKNEP
jgi:uncharacterized protein YbaR (Trm112 family)